jgi:ADP-heptose:LPS heptosyltransferase
MTTLKKPLVSLCRLSAIGDCFIACEALKILIEKNAHPIFITSPFFQDVAEQIKGLEAYILFENKETITFFYKKEGFFVKASYASFLTYLEEKKIDTSQFHFLDLQATTRSRRALASLKRFFREAKFHSLRVEKNTKGRFLLILKSLFKGQKKESHSFLPQKNMYVRNLEVVQKFLKTDVCLPKTPYFEFYSKEVLAPSHEKDVPPILKSEEELDLKNLNDAILIFPNSSFPLKNWPKESFYELNKLLLTHLDRTLVIMGGSKDGDIGAFLASLNPKRILNAAGHLTLLETLKLISRSSLIITNDSFATHASYLLQKNALVLFGPTSPLFGFVPNHRLEALKHIKILYAQLGCSPCTRHGKGSCRFGNLKCFQSLKPEEVFEEALKMLSKSPS